MPRFGSVTWPRRGERLFAAFARFGAVGPEAVRQLGAITQVARQATGGPEQAATAVEALVRALTNAATIDAIETTLSVRVRRDDGSFRDLDQVLAEIATATGGDPVVLSKIFDAEAIRVIGQAASAQGRADYQRYLGVEPAGNELAADAATMAATIAAQGQDVKTAIDARLYDWLTGPLGIVAQTIAAYKEELFTLAAAGLVGRGAFRLTRGAAARGLGLFRRRGPAPTPAAGAGAVRMLVGTTTAGPSLTAQTAGRPLGRLAQAGSALRAASGRVTNLAGRVPGAGLVRSATRRAPALAAATGTISVAGSLARGRTGEAAETGGGLLGGIGGWLGGAKAGAALGAFGGPAAWATIPAGAIIGGLAGGWLGDTAGRAAARHAFGEDESGGGLLPDAALDAAGELDTLAAQADAAGRALETLRPARPHPTIHQDQRIKIGPITIQSAADNPRDVADAVTDQVVDRVRQALADEQRRLADTLVADPSPEGTF